MRRQLCIALHDVAPATWPQCERLLALTDEFGQLPITLLVVPNFHGRGRVGDAPAIARAIERRVDRGAEVALHGYFHRDDALPPRTPADWLRRRVLTAREGEFAALARDEAASRIDRGWKELSDLFRPVHGFVAPAWLSSEGTWSALRQSPIRYASTRRSLIALDGMRRVDVPALSLSTRSRWRRVASRVWLRALCRATAALPLVRLALHPADAQYPEAMEDWRSVLRGLLGQREPTTKSRALGVE
jgi:predicted deacetylase